MVFINMTVVVVRLLLFEKRIKELGDLIRIILLNLVQIY